jgi:hypothetical protein
VFSSEGECAVASQNSCSSESPVFVVLEQCSRMFCRCDGDTVAKKHPARGRPPSHLVLQEKNQKTKLAELKRHIS